MKPDLLITWTKHCDYPIFRRFLRQRRDFFGKIIIYWSEHFRDIYFDEFIQQDLATLGNIQFLQSIEYKYGLQDWRNIATTFMLKYTDSEWVSSVEQDFLSKEWDRLLNAATEASKTYDFLGFKGYQGQNAHQESYLTGNYVHPSFWFIRRDILERTSKDFSANVGRGCDHFGIITQDAERLKIPIWYTQDNGFPENETFHQGGINNNYLEGLKDGFNFHRPELFYIYNYWSMKVDVPQDTQFMELMEKMDNKLELQMPDVNPEADSRAVFFK